MPTYSIASALYMADDAGAFVGDPVEALRSVAASGYAEVELIAEGVGWEDGPPDSAPFRDALGEFGAVSSHDPRAIQEHQPRQLR